jgi:RNA polymerase sigma-70 factor (ECF subfamily)
MYLLWWQEFQPMLMNRQQEFVRLWTQHTRRIYAYLLTLVPHRSDADDLLQETGATLWEKFDQFEPGTNFFSWACQTAFYCVSNFRRRKGAATLVLNDDVLEVLGRESAAGQENIDTELEALLDCLSKLRDRDRDLIARRYRAGASIHTVSDEVGRSVEGLYKALQRIHGALFDCVRRRLAEEVAE